MLKWLMFLIMKPSYLRETFKICRMCGIDDNKQYILIRVIYFLSLAMESYDNIIKLSYIIDS